MSIGSISAHAGNQASAIQQAMQLAASGAVQNRDVHAAPPPPEAIGPTVNASGQQPGAIINVAA